MSGLPDWAITSSDQPVGLSGLHAKLLSEVEAQPIRWLWPGLIARGKTSLIAGNPGLGKSQATLSIAAIVSTGGRWPVSGIPAEPGRVLIFTTEDDTADTIRPRCEAAGADLSRIEVIEAASDPEGNKRPFTLRSDLDRLRMKLGERADVKAVIIDPLSAYCGDVDTHRNSEVRSAILHPLGELASLFDIAIIGVEHLSKNESRGALMRVNGSIGFVGQARAVMIVHQDKDDPRRRLLLTAKNNLAEDRVSLAFSVEGRTLESGISTSAVTWESEYLDMDADEAMTGHEATTEREDAKAFLQVSLTGSTLPAKVIQADAVKAGFSMTTIRRAKKELGIVSEKEGVGEGGRWVWRLP